MTQIQKSSLLGKTFIFFFDTITIALAVIGIFAFRTSDAVVSSYSKVGAVFQWETFLFYLVCSVGLLPLFHQNNLYKRKVMSVWSEQFAQIVKSYLTLALILIVILFFLKKAEIAESARGFIIGFTSLGVVLSSLVRAWLGKLVRRRTIVIDPHETRNALVIGAGRAGSEFALRILNDPDLGIEKAWFVDDDEAKSGTAILGFPVLLGTSAIQTHAFNTGADEIYVVINSIERERLLEIIELCRETKLPVRVLSRHFQIVATGGIADNEQTLETLALARPIEIRPGLIAKRMIDFIGSLILCTLLFVPCFIIALLIKLTSKGPIFYSSKRVGIGGKEFGMLKFRSMYVNDQSDAVRSAQERMKQGFHPGKVENDPRITPLGKILRKYSIDEIPQIINVLRGEMSLIGPRPYVPYEMALYDDWHKRRLQVLPGMTGLWQVTGRQIPNLNIHDAMILDVYYAENFTIWLDLKIIIKTIPVVLFGRGGK